jgi:hypothetical protein
MYTISISFELDVNNCTFWKNNFLHGWGGFNTNVLHSLVNEIKMDELCSLKLKEEVSSVVLNGGCAAQLFQLGVEINFDIQQKHIQVFCFCFTFLI